MVYLPYHFSKNPRWAYFRVGLLSVGFSFLKFGGPTIRWAYYPVGLLTGFYGIVIESIKPIYMSESCGFMIGRIYTKINIAKIL